MTDEAAATPTLTKRALALLKAGADYMRSVTALKQRLTELEQRVAALKGQDDGEV